MKFQKGRPKTGGRKPGSQNRVTLDIKGIALGLIQDPEYLEGLKKRLNSGKSPQLEVLLHYYGYGRPKVQIESDKTIRVLIERNQAPTIVELPAEVAGELTDASEEPNARG